MVKIELSSGEVDLQGIGLNQALKDICWFAARRLGLPKTAGLVIPMHLFVKEERREALKDVVKPGCRDVKAAVKIATNVRKIKSQYKKTQRQVDNSIALQGRCVEASQRLAATKQEKVQHTLQKRARKTTSVLKRFVEHRISSLPETKKHLAKKCSDALKTLELNIRVKNEGIKRKLTNRAKPKVMRLPPNAAAAKELSGVKTELALAVRQRDEFERALRQSISRQHEQMMELVDLRHNSVSSAELARRRVEAKCMANKATPSQQRNEHLLMWQQDLYKQYKSTFLGLFSGKSFEAWVETQSALTDDEWCRRFNEYHRKKLKR